MPGPLDGIRVLEMANFISGPYTGMLLGDLGAKVWKVELVNTGDPFRKWGGHAGKARPQFSAYNRGKKSLALDVTSPEGREIFRRLATDTDVLVENFRPGKLDGLGIGYEDLRQLNPGLIYCAISGMGRTGPLSRRPSYDSIGLALSGLWSRFVDLACPRPIGPQVADQLTSLYSVYGILGALVHRSRQGVGQRVDVSMLLANMAFLPEPVANFLALGEVGELDTRASRSQAYAFVAGDGLPLTVHLSSVPKFWQGLVRAVERPDLLEDERFATNRARVEHYHALRDLLDGVFRSRSRDEWLARLGSEDVPSAPINSLPEALDQPQARHVGAVHTYGTGERAVELVRCPIDYSATPVTDGGSAPWVGEHADEILAAVGYDPGDIQRFQAAGIVTVADGVAADG